MMNMLVGVLVEVIKTVSEIEREQPLVSSIVGQLLQEELGKATNQSAKVTMLCEQGLKSAS